MLQVHIHVHIGWTCTQRKDCTCDDVYSIAGNFGEHEIWQISHQNVLVNFKSRALLHGAIVYEIILAGYKFGNFPQNCQFAKLKSSPKFPAIQYVHVCTPCFWMETLVRCTNMLSNSLRLAVYWTVQNRQKPSLYLPREENNNTSHTCYNTCMYNVKLCTCSP